MSSKPKNKAIPLADAIADAIAAQENANQFQEDIDPDDFPEVITHVPSSDEQVLLNAIDELRGVEGVVVRVYRSIPGSRKLEYLFTPDFCNDLLGAIMETLQMEYGRGTYVIQARAPSDHGAGLRMNQTIQIGDMPKSKRLALERDIPQPVKDTGNDNFREMMQMQMQQAENSKREMMQMFTMMQSQQSAMVTAMLGRPEPARPEGLTIADAIALAKMMAGEKSDPMDTLIKGLELGKELGGGGGETNFADVLKSGISSLGGIVSKLPSTPPPMPQPVPRQANPSPLPHPVPVRQPLAVQTVPELPEEITAMVKVLEKGASRDGDPYTYAGMVLDILGDDEGAALCASPDNLCQLVTVFPALVPFGGWLERVRQAALHLLGGPEPDNMESDITGDGAENAAIDTERTVTGLAPDDDATG